ncbi:hypothetical protein JGH11_03125 [Dysgonomonas sp. Marseille-P4677]|uniref:hypothetical protein n=1 Tax=Dysgonomonas sp. Marseille-P4677 TaxID=2364790 RepID=UPI0019120505|nr:hypothetical protein [Dysgonomonas sp. Marseille-P4677]MBK5719856.1 hypothetical protein [Dysgonomonas sp. Marseille-P4677]
MKKIKIILLIISMAVFTIHLGYAQQKRSEDKAHERKTSMIKTYKLSEEQGKQIYDAALEFWKTQEELEAKKTPIPERRKLMLEADSVWKAKVKEIFTEEQHDKFMRIQEALKAKKKKK